MSDEIILRLSLIPGIGPAVIQRLLALSDDEICAADVERYLLLGIPRNQAQRLITGLRDMKPLHDEQARAEKYNVTIMTIQSPQYPAYLRAIHMPPPVLYIRGAVDIFERPSIAVIGSRAANSYGRAAVEMLVPPIVQEKWVVVSGGARGIDAYAHQETVRHGGTTVAVLGSGLLRPYPREHTSLFSHIVASGGAVMSPFPLTMSPLPGNFPARNRVISGLSRACLVVQAALKSGALITAMQALAEGRDVGVVPGPITDQLSAGCHKLLRDGASPITSADDIRELMGCHVGSVHVQSEALATLRVNVTSPLEEACRSPKSFDELLPLVDGDELVLYQKLWDLQVAGTIEQTATGLWRCL